MQACLEHIRDWFKGELLFNEPLARHVSLKVGGPVDLLATPDSREELQRLVTLLEQQQIPRFVLGGGFNLLPTDAGYRGCAISLKRINRLQLDDTVVTIEAGASNQSLARAVAELGLSGVEFLIGIPGSVGGAVRMNAGAHGSDIFSVVKAVTLLDQGQFRELPREQLTYGYRYFELPGNSVIVAVTLQLAEETLQTVRSRMEEQLGLRWATQNVKFPNAGSFFKNPPGESAWRLIDQAGLRGFSIGNAQVSEIHTNFLINRGDATAADFRALAAAVKERVKATCGIELEEEVQLLDSGECG